MRNCLTALVIMLMVPVAGAVPLDHSFTQSDTDSGRESSGLTEGEKAEYYYLNGLDLLSKGQLSAAQVSFENSLRHQEKQARSFLGLAEIAFLRKDNIEAGKLVNRALELEPNSPYVLNSYARYLYTQGKQQEARDILAKALKIDDRSAKLHLDIAELHANTFHDYQAAVFHFQKAIELEPEHAGAHYGLGMALLSSKDEQKGVKALEQAAELDSNNPIPVFALGNVYQQQGKLDKAIEHYQKAINIDDGFEKAYVALGDIHIARKEYSKAIESGEKFVRNHPTRWRVSLQLAIVNDMLGNYDQAERFYRKSLDVTSENSLVYNNLAWLLANRKGRYADAEQLARTAVKLAPENASFHDTLGWILMKKGQYREAINELSKSAELNPNDSSVQIHLGEAYKAAGQKDKAKEIFQNAIRASTNEKVRKELEHALANL